MTVSKEVETLHEKEGKLSDLVKSYLDIKKANYTMIGSEGVDLKGIRRAYVEPHSIIIEKHKKKYIIEPLSKVCGFSGRYHEINDIDVDTIIDNTTRGRILFKTFKDKKDLYIHTDLTPSEPTGSQSILIKDNLKEPSNIPDYDETYEINCNCEGFGKLKCKGHVWK